MNNLEGRVEKLEEKAKPPPEEWGPDEWETLWRNFHTIYFKGEIIPPIEPAPDKQEWEQAVRDLIERVYAEEEAKKDAGK